MADAPSSLKRIQVLAPRGFSLSEGAWTELGIRYSEPHRHYHTLDHLLHFAGCFQRVEQDLGWGDPHSVFAALLYHDAIYDPARPDNEAKSADLAAKVLGALEAEAGGRSAAGDPGRVGRLIRLTAFHGQAADDELGQDELHFLDADCAILGSAEADFARYEDGVAAEYAAVVDPVAYRLGRSAFLERLLARPVFDTRYFADLLETQARVNIRWALDRLETAS